MPAKATAVETAAVVTSKVVQLGVTENESFGHVLGNPMPGDQQEASQPTGD